MSWLRSRPVGFALGSACIAGVLGMLPLLLRTYVHVSEPLLAIGAPLLTGFFVLAITIILLAQRGDAGFKVAFTVLGVWLVVCPCVATLCTFVVLHLLPPLRIEVDGVMREFPRSGLFDLRRALLRGLIVVGGGALGLFRGLAWALRRRAVTAP